MKHGTSVLGTAIAMALTATVVAGCADQGSTLAQASVQKCYGVNAVAKNDCKAGAHDCAGHATTERDPASFVALPVGICTKIAGGRLTPGS
ncbi:MAG TPA: DUF2282 domain-containing protein [Stellaceae bacterium]|nr:DUF2282 domain-containing protein [Stellaceae bacterium]